MKVKHLERSANVAWSPKSQTPILLAAGTAAQQLDASFNTSAVLEIFSLNITEPGPDLELKGSTKSDHRFHKIVWSDHNNSTIIGGCDNGIINIYNANKILSGEDALVKTQNKHSGPVHALDVNPFQQNLFASGAGESEIFIWDLNNINMPMTPGTKTQPFEDVLSVAWNRQVQHILASTFSTKCVIWDLRKNEPIIKLCDTISRIRWKDVAWHPEVATQLCLASEEDHSPNVQVWDLRFATSPLRTVEYHNRGVLSIAWCDADSDLLVSCGKDNRIICWNPNSNDLQPKEGDVSEIASTNQWIFNIAWCPRNPALIACPSFDGNVSIYSLMGGKTQQVETTNKIADSFPGMDGYVQAPVVHQQAGPTSVDLNKAPKWMKKPVGATFGFGGKLITFEHDKSKIAQVQQALQSGQMATVSRTVEISQVITEPELVQNSAQLEAALATGEFKDYCRNKADTTNDQHKKYIWHFLRANFEENSRAELLNLLGYRIEDVNNKLSQFVDKSGIDGVTNLMQNVNRENDVYNDEDFINFSTNNDDFNSLDDFGANGFDSIIGNTTEKPVKKFKIKTGDDTEGLITQALLLGNVEAAVELCLKAKRFADAIIIAMTGGTDLLARTQHKYLEQSEGYVSSLISALVSEDWTSVINNCEIDSWKEALAATLTHSSDEDLPLLCEQLGSRLETEGITNSKLTEDAQLCYICSGSFEKLVNSWSGNAMNSTQDLQELVELVMFLQKAVERQGRNVQISGSLADLLSHYASLLAAQGNTTSALSYLGYSDNEKVVSLRDRLLVNLGQKNVYTTQTSQTRRSIGYPEPARFAKHFPPQPQPTNSRFNNFNVGLPPNSANLYNNPTPGYAQTQPTGTFSPPPPVALPSSSSSQPPRPPSVGSNQGSGLPSRSKYLRDPSVSSNQYGNVASQGYNQFLPPTNPMNQSLFQTNAVQSSNNSNLYTPPQMTGIAPAGPLNPLQPSLNSNMMAPPVNNPLLLPARGNRTNPNSRTQSISEPEVGNYGVGDGFNYEDGRRMSNAFNNGQIEQAQAALGVANAAAAHGWNDPPVLNRAPRQSQYGDVVMSAEHAGTRRWKNKSGQTKLKPETGSNEPITHPIYGSAPVSQPGPPNNNNFNPEVGYPVPALPGYSNNNMQPPQPNSMYGGGGPQDMNQQPQMFQPPPMAGGNFSPNNYNTNAISGAVFGQTPSVNSQQVAPVSKPQPVQKAPIPEEHVHMKTVFDALKEECTCASNNPQTKRKLEDVGKKLETLYDLLREHALSQNTLSNLHNLVALVQRGDYSGGLQLYMQLASGPDFAQIASFMPGIKVLLAVALQLQVYIS